MTNRHIKAAKWALAEADRNETLELRDIGLRCPRCAYEKMRATDSWCWRCGHFLGEDWVAPQS